MKTISQRNFILCKRKTGYIRYFLLLFLFIGCNNTEIPKEVQGIWVTEDPKCTNYKMEITED
jgi:hypothetical protein